MVDAYFSGPKIRWILDNVPGARRRAEAGELLFGTVETWLIWLLTGGRVHVTDYSNASRTMLFNINTLDWDEELLDLMDIPRSMLPTPVPSSQVYGETDPGFFGRSIPHCRGRRGPAGRSLRSGLLYPRPSQEHLRHRLLPADEHWRQARPSSSSGLVTTVAWGLGNRVSYALEGSIFVAGAAIQWLRDEMRLIDSAADSEYHAGKVADTAGCYVVPAFTGLGAPYWDQYARGAIVG